MPIEPIPPETVRVAGAAFPQGHRYLLVADALEILFTDDAFRTLLPPHGQPAHPPWRLALVTILPCTEGLSDRQAANAVRSRLDWTHVLRLELTDAGFDASGLSECRSRLIIGAAEAHHSASAELSSTADSPATGSHGGASGGVCSLRRHRKDDLVRNTQPAPATDPRHRP
jgi:transposase